MLQTQTLADLAATGLGAVPAVLPASCFTCARSDPGLGVVGVRLTGELDLATAPLLKRTLHEARVDASLVVLDLRELTFIDCSGVRVIVNAALHARRDGHRLIAVPGPPQVDRLFTLTGAADIVETAAVAR